MVSNPIVIAGPCSAESDEQMDIAIEEASKREVDFVRCNLYKPRDIPAFDGLGEKGAHLLGKVARAGLNPALEVMMPEHVDMAMESALPHLRAGGKLLLWIGARNQNHIIQDEIAKRASKDDRVWLMVKNQPWVAERHWKGILTWVLDAGMPAERLLNCYRGYTPSYGDKNPEGFRNLVNFEEAMRVKEATGIPMLFDPSHTGGTVENVLKMSELSAKFDFDGMIIELHHDPEHAFTDAKQQLTWQQYDQLLEKMQAAAKA
jgi:3-deoxy-D-arabino-heptulosonate 7-phosphate (DAHP) synthase